MSSTIRTYRHSPDYATDPTGTLVDTETDADDGPFTVTVDTTGWSAGNYQVTATREYTTGGLSESAKSNALAVTANVAGNSDDFAHATQVALTTHNANWGDLVSTRLLVSDLEVDGTGICRKTTAYDFAGARYTTSSADISQIVVKAQSDTNISSKGVTIRSNGTRCYRAWIYGGGGTANYTNWTLYSIDGATETYMYGTEYTGAHNADHVLRLVASGTNPVSLSFYVDSVQQGSTHNDSTYLYTDGGPGFAVGNIGTQSNGNFDDWQDY